MHSEPHFSASARLQTSYISSYLWQQPRGKCYGSHLVSLHFAKSGEGNVGQGEIRGWADNNGKKKEKKKGQKAKKQQKMMHVELWRSKYAEKNDIKTATIW